MARLFGTDGVRGTANVELTPELALLLGMAAGRLLGGGDSSARILIGRDTRRSGDMLQAAVAAGLCSAGVDAISAGIITTPAVAMLSRTQDFRAGVVISASHNAAPENGIKFLGHDGYKLADEVEARIEDLVQQMRETPLATPPISGAAVGRCYEDPGIRLAYQESIARAVEADLSGIKIVMDGANGAGSVLNAEVLTSLGLDVTVIHAEPDGMNINEACGSTHPESLCRAVVEQGADLGAAFDGDGDRVILCDANGRIVDGDHVLAMCALHWKDTERLPGNVIVGTVMSNLGLEKALEENGVTLLRASVGDRYVMELMKESGATIGGEKSGHIIFGWQATTGDGLLTLLKALGIMASTGKSMGELASVMEEYPQILIGVRVAKKEGWDASEEVRAALEHGHQALEGRGRLLVRPSGTESLIRIMAEGPDHDELVRITQEIAEVVRLHAGA